MKRNQQGFTLIELIVVIVILGILAVSASPKFIDLTSDAQESSVNGLKGSVKGAVGIVYSKALIDSKTSTDDESESVTVGGSTINLVFGYPSAETISSAIDIDTTNDWSTVTNTAGDAVRIYPSGVTAATDGSFADGDDCYLTYTESASDGASPSVTVTTTGC